MKSSSMKFVLLMGVVSLFADMTYEGARSITGPYLAVLGAGGTAVGLTAGLGELLGYALRFFTGLLSDKTGKYWLITITGYAINLLAVPLLALAGRWEIAAILMITERIGKAIRTPARDAMLSHAASNVGTGWAFAVHEAMDQIGAMTGPVIVMAVLAIKGSYKHAFAVLLIPAVLAMIVLFFARISFPEPKKLEAGASENESDKFPREFWLYILATGFVAAGFADYPLIAFHIKHSEIFADKWIPLLYACSMGVDALSALLFGKLYDKKGIKVLITAIAISCPFAVFAFSLNPVFIFVGVVLWGIGMGAQESIIRSVVADIVPANKRGTGFGIFNAGYGLAWFLGSLLIGFLYDISILALIAFSIVSQVIAIPFLISVNRYKKHPQV